jgi:hypothetical protein
MVVVPIRDLTREHGQHERVSILMTKHASIPATNNFSCSLVVRVKRVALTVCCNADITMIRPSGPDLFLVAHRQFEK